MRSFVDNFLSTINSICFGYILCYYGLVEKWNLPLRYAPFWLCCSAAVVISRYIVFTGMKGFRRG